MTPSSTSCLSTGCKRKFSAVNLLDFHIRKEHPTLRDAMKPVLNRLYREEREAKRLAAATGELHPTLQRLFANCPCGKRHNLTTGAIIRRVSRSALSDTGPGEVTRSRETDSPAPTELRAEPLPMEPA